MNVKKLKRRLKRDRKFRRSFIGRKRRERRNKGSFKKPVKVNRKDRPPLLIIRTNKLIVKPMEINLK